MGMKGLIPNSGKERKHNRYRSLGSGGAFGDTILFKPEAAARAASWRGRCWSSRSCHQDLCHEDLCPADRGTSVIPAQEADSDPSQMSGLLGLA